jgi:signal transduction histidine kinase
MERSDTSAIVDMAISNLRVAIDESHAIVTRTSLPVVRAYPSQLVQVFQNLIGNAVKYHRPEDKPKVYVDVKPSEQHWTFSVGDNGIGIPEADKEKVFEPFKRLHSRDEYPGSGLGLFLCRKIVEKHGGRIWFEAREGGPGTVFRFTLPRALNEAEEKQSERAQ